ncbi:type II toxin-antitoxin system antitoxin TsaA [Staphylococcus sp. SUC_1.2]|uniref:type II toxin-antitoxin system antitoxin TsaA n=1 Tax=Staphylococcus sp. SUC_1.2 TaxID=2969256 RepID=UPI003A5998A8
MNINKLFWINIMITLLFLGFNITVTYFPKLDDYFWLIPGLIICDLTISFSLIAAILDKNLISEIIFLTNLIIFLYYIYPLIYNFF